MQILRKEISRKIIKNKETIINEHIKKNILTKKQLEELLNGLTEVVKEGN